MATPETRSELVTLVVAMFDAAPGTQVLSDLVVASDAGSTNAQIAANLAVHPEFTGIYPTFMTNAEFVNKFVDSMVGDLVVAAEKNIIKAALTAEMNNGATRVDVIMSAIAALSAVPEDDAVWGDASAAFANKVEVAEFHTIDQNQPTTTLANLQAVLANVDETDASVTQAKADISGDATEGEEFDLTVGADTLEGTAFDDTFNAFPVNAAGDEANTFASFDSIDGGAGTDTLNIYTAQDGADFNATMPSSTTVENVEIINIYNEGATFQTSGGNVVASRFVGAEQVWQRGDSSNNVTGLAAGVAAGFGGHNLAGTQVTAATGAASISVALDGVTGSNTLETNGSNTVNVSGSLATGADLTVEVNKSGATATTATVNSAVDATVLLTGTYTTLNAAGSTGDLTYNTTATQVNATTGSGDDTVSIAVAAKVTVATGAGDDTVSVDAAMSTGSTVNLGAGDDVLTAAGGSFGAGVIVDGGEGSDAISASLINAANAGNVKNFELLDLSEDTATPLDIELLTGSTVSSLVLNGGAGDAAVNNVAAGLGLVVVNDNTGETTIGVKGATSATSTADAFTVTFDDATTATAAATASANLVIDGVESVSIVSGGTGLMSNTLTLVDADAVSATNNTIRTITVSGDKDLTLEFDGTIGSTGTGNGLSAVDAGAATGDVTIDFTTATAVNLAAAGLTVTTGSGDDTITLAAKATVVAGAGDDTIVSAAAGGTFTGGAGEDTFDVSAAVATAATEVGSVFVTIADLQADDSIDFGIGATFEAEEVELGVGVNNLDQALAAAVTTAGEVSWFQYGTNTYVVASADATFGAGDVVVKLTGLVDLSDATLDGTVLTMA